MGSVNARSVSDNLEQNAKQMGTNHGRDSEEQGTVSVFNRKRTEARRGVKRRLFEVNAMFHLVRRISDVVMTFVESTASDGGAGSGEEDLDAQKKEAVKEQTAKTRWLTEKQQ